MTIFLTILTTKLIIKNNVDVIISEKFNEIRILCFVNMHTNNNVIFKIDFRCIIKKIVLKSLLIDKKINKNKQIFKICKNQLIKIYFERFRINNQFVFNVSKFNIVLI